MRKPEHPLRWVKMCKLRLRLRFFIYLFKQHRGGGMMRREEGGGVGGHCNWDTGITAFLFFLVSLSHYFLPFPSRAALP
jgi:hypothetical protein